MDLNLLSLELEYSIRTPELSNITFDQFLQNQGVFDINREQRQQIQVINLKYKGMTDDEFFKVYESKMIECM